MCQHRPQCPPPESSDREAAHVVAHHPEQGWSVSCTDRLSGTAPHRKGVGA
ncbi:DUF5999 family protein [Streptomyces tubercidicus]|uniref:DUF5999 family protein n=1 Tax=Streptomyces tubercidicus TaxID=47759 RepID=UPI003681E8F4